MRIKVEFDKNALYYTSDFFWLFTSFLTIFIKKSLSEYFLTFQIILLVYILEIFVIVYVPYLQNLNYWTKKKFCIYLTLSGIPILDI